ncbi:MAG: DUF4153 domain-containing protein [Rhizomicrobium sp.]
MQEQQAQVARGERFVFAGRLIVGLLQGLALYLLYSAFEDKTWPATDGALFAPLVVASLFIPVLVVQSLENLRAATLIIWTLWAAAIVAGFAWYDIWHGWPTETGWFDGSVRAVPRILPSFGTFFFSAVFLFIAHALISAADADRRIVARYHTHFDLAWKQGLQFVLAFLFVGVFWVLLWLGAYLFKMIDLDFLQKLIEHRWFSIPATALAGAAAIHITDVRAVLVRGARSLVLALLSWLLPLIVLIAAGFLVALFFTGLGPLWKTRIGTSMLLAAAAWLVVLINAAYQDGDPERRPVRVLRIAGTLGGLLLVPIVALAGYALWLRIQQYGWTAERISATACIIVAGAFALGYAVAALWPRTWFKPLERWNFITSLLVLAVIAALFSCVADPMRISVASQVARLEGGKIAPDKFDFSYLRWEGGRFGKDALARLEKSKNAEIALAAKTALVSINRYDFGPKPATPDEIKIAITVYPKGKRLPADFLKQDWHGIYFDSALHDCMTQAVNDMWRCDAVVKDIDGDGVDEILLVNGSKDDKSLFWNGTLFKKVEGKWVVVGNLRGESCRGDREAVLAGNFKTIAPLQPDFEIAGRRIVLTPEIDRRCK